MRHDHFHLLRHGEHTLQGKIVAGRMPGIGLSERGRAEAAAAAERLAEAGIAAIYASPLQRAHETAGIVAAGWGSTIVTRHELDRARFRRVDRLDLRRCAARPALAGLGQPPQHRDDPRRRDDARGAAPHRRERSSNCIDHHGEDAVVLVSHGDVIRAGLAFALGMPIDYLTRIEVATGSLSTVRIDAGGIRVIDINDRAWATQARERRLGRAAPVSKAP